MDVDPAERLLDPTGIPQTHVVEYAQRDQVHARGDPRAVAVPAANDPRHVRAVETGRAVVVRVRIALLREVPTTDHHMPGAKAAAKRHVPVGDAAVNNRHRLADTLKPVRTPHVRRVGTCRGSDGQRCHGGRGVLPVGQWIYQVGCLGVPTVRPRNRRKDDTVLESFEARAAPRRTPPSNRAHQVVSSKVQINRCAVPFVRRERTVGPAAVKPRHADQGAEVRPTAKGSQYPTQVLRRGPGRDVRRNEISRRASCSLPPAPPVQVDRAANADCPRAQAVAEVVRRSELPARGRHSGEFRYGLSLRARLDLRNYRLAEM